MPVLIHTRAMHRVFPLLCLFVFSASLHAADYHVSNTGRDDADGLTPATAWNSLARVNQVTFQPGDRLLFKSGGHWSGQLRPHGSGIQGKPIRLGRYGEGPLPKIRMGRPAGVVVRFENQDFWEVSELEISGGKAKSNAVVGGIHFVATNAGRILRHIVVRDCVIRDLGGSFLEYESCGIWVGVEGWNQESGLDTTFESVRIENNRIRNTGRCGILVWTCSAPAGQAEGQRMFRDGLLPSRNVIIRKNTIEALGGDAILVLGSVKPLIESNTVRRACLRTGDPAVPAHLKYNPSSAAIWLHSCLEGVMQFNEVSESGKQPRNNDGMAFDFDFNCKGCLLQYNYSRDNAGGFLLIMPSARDNIARYNLSINDRDHLLFLVGKLEENNLVHNNTFHLRKGDGYLIPRARLWNNLFFVGGSASLEEREGGGEFHNNAYYGNWKKLPADPSAILKDPLFHHPAIGKDTISTFRNHMLRPGSPCRARGLVIPNHGGRDLRGTELPGQSPPDLGALQSPIMPLRHACKDQFLIGTAVPPLNHYHPGELRLLTKHFATVTPENCMKPMFLQPEEGRFDFATADSLVDQARSRGLTVNGHTLVWHSQTPDWFFCDGDKPAGRELLLARMRAHISAVAGHFAGKVASWDVVNEAIDDGGGDLRQSPWLTGIGPDFVAEAFIAAHKADPGAKLYYNDYGIETTGKMEKTLRLIRELKTRNAPIHGVGIQGHYQLDRIPFDQIAKAILAYHAEGLEVAITELDIDVATRSTDGADISQTESVGADRFANGLPDDVQTRLADQYAALFALYLKHRDKIKRVTFWGLHDGCSWLNHFPSERTNHPLLWDRKLQPKPAYFRVLDSAR
jgi:endo-1,4-beta-xylanase